MPKDIHGLPEGAGQPGTIVVLGITSLLINLLGLMVPLLLMQVFNRIIPNQALNTLSMLVITVLIALMVDGAIQTLRSHVVGWIGARFVHKGSCRLLRRLLFAEPREFERVDGAKYLEQMNAIHTIGDLYSGQAMIALFDLPFLLLFLFMIFKLGGILLLIPLLSVGAISIFSSVMGEKLHKTLDTDMRVNQRRFSFITETLSRIHAVKSMAMEAQMLRRYEMLQLGGLRHTYDIIFRGGIIPVFSSFASQASTALIVGLGALQVIHGDMTTGGLAACTMLAGRIMQPLQTLVRGWTKLQSTRLAKAQIDELFGLPQRPPPVESDTLEGIEGGIELHHVTCRFDQDAPLFNDLTLTIEPNRCIGLIGKSGDGKTTLLKLIAGAVLPTEGEVRIDGVNRTRLPAHLHAGIGYVPQVGVLFNATLLENLTMFNESRNHTALRIATELGLDAIVARMPQGYQTPIGEGVSDILPAGVIQRIAIIRVLAMEPKILLFDEANTAIDSAGDILLRNHLETLKGRCTLLLVSERPSLLRITDRCYQFKDGTLAPLTNFMDALNPPAPPASDPAVPAPTLPHAALLAASLDPSARENPNGPAPTIPTDGETSDEIASPPRHREDWRLLLDQMPGKNRFTHCLGGLLESLRWRGTGRQLAEAIPHLMGELDLTGLCNVMANLNFTHKMERGEIGSVDARLTPFLFVFDDGRVEVIQEKRSATTMVVASPEAESTNAVVELEGHGTAFFFSPPQEEPATRMGWVRTQLLRFRQLIWNLMAITIIGNIMTTAMPIYVMVVYDRVIPTGSISTGMVMLIGTLFALLVDASLRIHRVHLLAYIGTKLERSLSGIILNQILGLPAALTEQISAGNQVSRLRSLEVVREIMTGPLAMLFYDIPTTLLFLITLSFISPNVIAMMMLLIAAMVLVAVALLPVIQIRSNLASQYNSRLQAFLTEALSRIQTIQSTHSEEIWFERFRDLSGKATLANFKLAMLSNHMTTLARLLTMAAGVGVMNDTARSVVASDINHTGVVIASMLMTWRILSPLQTLFLGITKIVGIVNSVTQLDRLMELKPERGFGSLSKARKEFQGEIAFARVSFRYSSDAEPALVGVSFRVSAGSVVAVIGANGSGKSTLIKMILGLYDPQAGSVLIDNNDIRQINALQLRHAIGYLPQQCDIFFGSVAQNLRLVRPDASDEELREACARAGLLEEIMQMPKGFESRLQDSRSDQLSAGFKQRLSLARALLKKSRIMLFDEPANNMDAKSEALFRQAVQEMRGTTTIFIVTHRPSHLKLADQVLFLDRGYLRAAGPPAEIEKLLPRSFV
ncbi:ATP-binding cassette, subfamily C, type I secretion system permease/ATPase [Candidatus Magnetaquicoccaceae bacterium FCR-1]|uniref:ATP-binding cassette, subfamily C, type I secretion system permease/ATPase n=1 Tax=Candidatus Magnetaquiglobus chichijimensis TaxID=3141448 RepID=A0ABQ0C726_9PROT